MRFARSVWSGLASGSRGASRAMIAMTPTSAAPEDGDAVARELPERAGAAVDAGRDRDLSGRDAAHEVWIRRSSSACAISVSRLMTI